MLVVPAVRPLTTPDVMPIMATAGLLLLHVPPATDELREETVPWHMLVLPVITASG